MMLDDGVPLLLSLINYAKTLVCPADDEAALRTALATIGALGIELSLLAPAIARDAARLRASNVSLADASRSPLRARTARSSPRSTGESGAARTAGVGLAPAVR